jgi:hypothetical protein
MNEDTVAVYSSLVTRSTASVAQTAVVALPPSPEVGWHPDHRQLVETATLFVPVVILVCAYKKTKRSKTPLVSFRV